MMAPLSQDQVMRVLDLSSIFFSCDRKFHTSDGHFHLFYLYNGFRLMILISIARKYQLNPIESVKKNLIDTIREPIKNVLAEFVR